MFDQRFSPTRPRARWLRPARAFASAGLVAMLGGAGCGGAHDVSTAPAPVPALASITPPTIAPGSAGPVTVTVDGSNFVSTSAVDVDGAPRPTTFVNATRLTAALPAADVAPVGTHQVTVVNPPPGGGVSNVVFLTVRAVDPGAPTLASVTPNDAPVGGDLPLTVTGTNFVNASVVVLAKPGAALSVVLPTTFVSSTQLTATVTAAQLPATGTYLVRVINPYLAGASPIAALTVHSPVPVLSGISKTTTTAGAAADTLDLQGTGFFAGSEARVGGAVRPTVFVGATRLRVALSGSDLATPGDVPITVTNPAPGGGVTPAQVLHVVAIVPVITRLPSAGGTAGRGGFDLAVDGANFVTSSVVQWNGADRPTTFRAGTRITVTLGAADVASAGTARVTVRTPGVAAASNPADFGVRSFGAPAVTQLTSIALAANDVIADPTNGLVYASVPSRGGTYANSVVAIDPTTAAVVKSAVVGSEPGPMALSDDGQFLYVSLAGSGSVRRVTLASFTPNLEWSLGGGVVEEMLVVPGAPHTVVMSTMRPNYSPRHIGVFVYDDGVARARATSGYDISNSLAFAGAAPPVYGVDPELRTKVGAFSFSTLGQEATLHVDPRLGRVFLLFTGSITAYDMNTFQSVGSVSVPGTIDDHSYALPLRLARWSADGFAYRDGARVYFVRTTLAAP